ncbi:MAG: hypothetical protein GYA24_16435, partial [Candidatus Lokiarchaeota archaeon]|nr:hypothetical protein [Candidatus Lokiarchaeota archaeon]
HGETTAEKVLATAREYLAAHGEDINSVAIMLNTVTDAIAVSAKMRDEAKKDKKWQVILLHSRLPGTIKKHRIAVAKDALKAGSKVMVVATQVIEASVNIDFDAAITVAVPADSLIQRMGRVFRNRSVAFHGQYPNVVIVNHADRLVPGRDVDGIYDPEYVAATLERAKNVAGTLLDGKAEEEILQASFTPAISGRFNKAYSDMVDYIDGTACTRKSDVQRLFRNLATWSIVLKGDGDFAARLSRQSGMPGLLPNLQSFYAGIANRRERSDLTGEERLVFAKLAADIGISVSRHVHDRLFKAGALSTCLFDSTVSVLDVEAFCSKHEIKGAKKSSLIDALLDNGLDDPGFLEALESKPGSDEWSM